MIASTSWGPNTKIGISGWPETMPSASDSARSSIGYFLESVRNGGAGGWGLSPSLPIAWQREQFSLTRTSPLSTRFLSAALAGAAQTTISATAKSKADALPKHALRITSGNGALLQRFGYADKFAATPIALT